MKIERLTARTEEIAAMRFAPPARPAPLTAWLILLMLALTLTSSLTMKTARAQLRVDIAGVGATQYPIAIADLMDASGQGKGAAIAQIIRDDLTRSGQFRLISTSGAVLNLHAALEHDNWRARGADYIVLGTVAQNSADQYTVHYRLEDTLRRVQLDEIIYTGSERELRRMAHQIADRIFENVTGVRGVFSTRIAYVLQNADGFELQIADADGQNPQIMLRSKASIISPAWSPDGTQLAYVSFETGKPVIYVQTLASAQRQPVANYRGNNSAPAWSPDGKKLAVALSRDGISQLYSINADGSGLRRLMRSSLIDTEPQYAPDGKSIVFTSDRSGAPQIYRLNLANNQVNRLTFIGDYNISPALAPNGQSLAYITRRDNAYRVALQNLRTADEQLLTNGPDDQSPSFAPNGMQILYSSVRDGRSVLSVVSSDGRVRQTLSTLDGVVREPTWGPFQSQ